MTAAVPQPDRGRAQPGQEVGRACPYCRFPLEPGAEFVRCGVCAAIHHDDCWAANGGCAVVACAAGPGPETTFAPPRPRVRHTIVPEPEPARRQAGRGLAIAVALAVLLVAIAAAVIVLAVVPLTLAGSAAPVSMPC